jgi:hypothetical protein
MLSPVALYSGDAADNFIEFGLSFPILQVYRLKDNGGSHAAEIAERDLKR